MSELDPIILYHAGRTLQSLDILVPFLIGPALGALVAIILSDTR